MDNYINMLVLGLRNTGTYRSDYECHVMMIVYVFAADTVAM